MLKFLTAAFDHKAAPYLVAALAVAASACFALLLLLAPGQNLEQRFDVDQYGQLGMGLWQKGVLAFYFDPKPTIQRGPVYPAFLAAILWLTRGWYPQGIYLAQSLVLGGICLAVWALGRRLFNRRTALWASLVCAVHPFLLWYTAKIWVENLQALLFTLILLATLVLSARPNLAKAFLLGVLLGLASLTKAVMLPFIVVIPAGLLLLRPVRVRPGQALAVAAVALLLVAPWTLRNLELTGRFIPVHGLGGFNMVAGDEFARHWSQAPLSYSALFNQWALPRLDDIKSRIPTDLPLWEQHQRLDELAMAESLATYRQEPLFLLKKILVNSYMFWVLGFTPLSTVALVIMQLPLLWFFVRGAAREVRERGLLSIQALLVAVICLYFVLHLPIFSFARLSNVLVPTMLIFACARLLPRPLEPPDTMSPPKE